MSIMSRDFTTREKVIILILVLFLMGFCYYQFIDKPVRESLANAEAETAAIQMELTSVQVQIAQLERMRAEIDDITAGGLNSYMPSYNNSKAELKLLNDILSSAAQYSVTFTSITRNGDQIRRNFSLQFTAPDYDSMKDIINQLSGVSYRCLIGDLRCGLTNVRISRDVTETYLSVAATATFYETMVGGVPDAGLPADDNAK